MAFKALEMWWKEPQYDRVDLDAERWKRPTGRVRPGRGEQPLRQQPTAGPTESGEQHKSVALSTPRRGVA